MSYQRENWKDRECVGLTYLAYHCSQVWRMRQCKVILGIRISDVPIFVVNFVKINDIA